MHLSRWLNFTKGGSRMFRYAQVNENGCVDADSYLSGVVEAENMIRLALDFDLTNKRWNGTGWEEYDPEPAPPPPLSEQEQVAIDTALNVEYIACLMEANL